MKTVFVLLGKIRLIFFFTGAVTRVLTKQNNTVKTN